MVAERAAFLHIAGFAMTELSRPIEIVRPEAIEFGSGTVAGIAVALALWLVDRRR